MFFFFSSLQDFHPGTVCEVITSSRTGQMVIVREVRVCIWAHEAKPLRTKINSRGREVVEYDPACVTSPFAPGDLRIITGDERAQITGPLYKSYSKGSWSFRTLFLK